MIYTVSLTKDMNQLRNQRIISAARCYPLFCQIKCSTKSAVETTRNLIKTPLAISVTRSFATDTSRRTIPKKFQKQLLPFEVQTNAVKDILLYSFHQKERKFNYITYGGIFLFIVCLNSSDLIYRFMSNIKPASPDEEYPWYYWWKKYNFDSKVLRIGVSGFIICFGFVLLAFALTYPSQWVREITLLKGGEKILLQTFRPFGAVKTRELSVKDVSALFGPTESDTYLPIRLRGKRLPLLVDQEGKYHDKELFDQTVGLYRF